jgi:hypothetical protein
MPVTLRALFQNEPASYRNRVIVYLRRFKSLDNTAKEDITAVKTLDMSVSELGR